MPASTSRTPARTLSGVSRLMRPSSSSSPQSPQVEPGGRCVHRFVTAWSPSRGRSAGVLLAGEALHCTDPWLSLARVVRVMRERHFRTWGGHRMTKSDFVVSADGHLLEPPDLFRTRMPEHLRDRAVWEEDFEIEPLVEDGARIFRRLHTSGYEGWTISRYRQTRGRMPEGDPEHILGDMDLDGVDVQVMHPNLSLFGLDSDDHERSMAHARVYNDYVIERFTPYFDRLAPTAPIPITDIDDAVAEIQRVATAGFRAILLPATPPKPYYSREFDPVWAAAQANGVHVFIHTQTGGVKVNDPASTTLKVVMESAAQVNQPMTEKSAAKRMVTQSIYSTIVPQQVICELIGGGVPERYPG